MVQLTRAAEQRLNSYLRQLRFVLRSARTLDADEVERDVQAHIESELGQTHQPVDHRAIEGVLDRLGSPLQWMDPDELPWWKRTLLRLRFGPGDWGLPLLAFGLLIMAGVSLALGLASLPYTGTPVESVGLLWAAVFIAASFLAARATVQFVQERGESLGTERWFVYPPLLIVYGAVLAAGLLGVPAVGGLVLAELFIDYQGAPSSDTLYLSCTGLFAGVWWGLLGGSVAVLPHWARAVFHPFGRLFSRRCGLIFGLLGLAVAAAALWVLPVGDANGAGNASGGSRPYAVHFPRDEGGQPCCTFQAIDTESVGPSLPPRWR